MFGFGAPRTASVSASQLKDRLDAGEKPLIIDVREPWEYAEGHIPGSVLKPLGQIRTWTQELNKSDEIIVICRTASRSGVAAQFMTSMGFTNVKNFSGGIITWKGKVAR